MIVDEAGIDDCRAEGARWVEAAAGEVDASEFGYKEGETDS